MGETPVRNVETVSVTVSPALRWYRKTALLNQSAGLTCKGTVRQRRPNARTDEERLALRRERGLKAWNNRVARLRARGLTSRGTERIYLVRRGDALLLKLELDALATELGAVFSELTPTVQARVLRLESHLSGIRKQIP